MLKRIFSFTIFFFLIFSFFSISKSFANECTFGYSYFIPAENKAVLPCININDVCYYAEIRVTPDGEIVLEDIINTGIEVPYLDYESDILSYYDASLGKLFIPEMRIGGPFGIDDGPFEVVLIPYVEDEQIKFEVDRINYTMASNICEGTSMKAVMITIVMEDGYTLPYCLEFMGPKSFKDYWVNHFKEAGTNTSFLEVIELDSCPKAVYSCLYYIDDTDPNNYGLMYLYWYDSTTVLQINGLCTAMAQSGAGAGPQIFNEQVVGHLLNLGGLGVGF